MQTRNPYRLNLWNIDDSDWTRRQQSRQTNIVSNWKTLAKEIEVEFDDKDCNVAIRAGMETSPLKSACRPTLKLEIVPAMKKIKASRISTGIKSVSSLSVP